MSLSMYRRPGAGLAIRRVQQRRPAGPPQLTAATIVEVNDRSGRARLDSDGYVDVTLPDALWLRPGDRVMLFRYPTGWVAVQRMVIGPALSVRG